ncbi:Ldh family oxidoreductase [Bacilliculturomica massiliensis]|uniref:Ldh family oxidoreductase n=1 Tax=Bacilliculturomica massiliensis TaxID=1917867 RepID=UPI00103237FB|nr:Ldh family oxidoreductase [Bacilliculturomica massiliensis]
MKRYNKEKIRKFVEAVFLQAGVAAKDAAQASEVIIQADSSGVETHGLARLKPYMGRYRNGGMNLTPNIHQINDSDVVIALDGDNGCGLLNGPYAMKRCIEAAKKYGAGLVTVNHSSHFGCGNYYGWNFAREGLIGIIFTNTAPLVSPTGGKDRLFGTNPLTIAIPAGKKDPVVLDMATTVVSLGKIQVKALAGESIPPEWAKDKDGNPTTDAAEALEGTLQPIAGYKGYGLALIIDIFCSVLAQASFGKELMQMNEIYTTKPEGLGQFMMAIDPSKLMPMEFFERRMEEYIDFIKCSSKAPGTEEILVPGEIEFRKFREIEENGIPVRDELGVQLVELCTEMGMNPNGATEFGKLLEQIC